MNNHKNKNDDSKKDFITSPSVQRAIKKARWKQVVLYTSISLVTLVVFMVLIFSGSQYLIAKKMEKESQWQAKSAMKSMAISSSNTRYDYNIFSAIGKTIYYKKIGDRKIVWDTVTKQYPVFGKVKIIDQGSGQTEVNQISDNEQRHVRYNQFNNQRKIDFYYPEIKYHHLPHELAISTRLDKNKLIEVALSFDKPRKVKEVKRLLGSPKNVDWLWVNSTSDKRMKELKRLQSDYQKVKHGEKADGIISKRSSNKKSAVDTMVSGAVVVGTPHELKKFQRKDFIRASVIGVTLDKY